MNELVTGLFQLQPNKCYILIYRIHDMQMERNMDLLLKNYFASKGKRIDIFSSLNHNDTFLDLLSWHLGSRFLSSVEMKKTVEKSLQSLLSHLYSTAFDESFQKCVPLSVENENFLAELKASSAENIFEWILNLSNSLSSSSSKDASFQMIMYCSFLWRVFI